MHSLPVEQRFESSANLHFNHNRAEEGSGKKSISLRKFVAAYELNHFDRTALAISGHRLRIDLGKSDMLLRPGLLSIVTAICTAATALAEEPGVIASMDAPRFQSPKEKGRSEIVEGKVGKATRFQLDNASSTTFFTSNIHGTADWDRARFFVLGQGDRFQRSRRPRVHLRR